MRSMRQLVASAGSRWAALGRASRLGVAAGLATFLAVSLHAATGGLHTPMTVLFAGLSQEDAQRIGERLNALGVAHQMAPDGASLLVPTDRVHEVRLQLASEGLPASDAVGFELFDAQRFGESEFSEQVKYHRALEGELARTISHIAGVQRTRVHLVLPTSSLFASQDRPASASVVLHMKPGARLSEERARGITHLVAASVRGLQVDHVTLVDGEGRRLGGGGGRGEGEEATDALDYRGRIERTKETAAQQMLDTAFGPGRSIVRVAAEVSFTREERTEEHFDPDTVAPRSFQLSEERTSRGGSSTTATAVAAAGVPGTASSLAGGAPPEAGPSNDANILRRSETRNFEVSKITKRAVEPVGRVTQMQVSVVVDGTWKLAGKERKFAPRTKEELQRIEAIVTRAVGLDPARGDKIGVECVPFAAPPSDGGVEVSAVTAFVEGAGAYVPWVLGLVGFLVLLVVVLALLRASARMVARVEPPSALLTTPIGTSEQRAQAQGAALTAGEADREMEDMRLLTSDIANRQPEVAARVIRGWLTEGNS